MKIITAQHMGLCFGVKDAIELASDAAKTAPTTILGPLAHNASIQSRLKQQGITFANQHQQVKTRQQVITAHGISDRTRQAIHQNGFEVKDATCPLVHFAHHTLNQLVEDGYYPVIIGKSDHIEVRGMTGDLDAFTVILDPQDVTSIPPHQRIGVIAQTTQPMDRVNALVKLIQTSFPEADVCFKDTVCRPTKQRQTAAIDLGKEADVVVVIGGKKSNNTKQLSQTVSKYCNRVHQIEKVRDLNRDWFLPEDTVGITAGTSTPDEVITPVIEVLESWAQARSLASAPTKIPLLVQ